MILKFDEIATNVVRQLVQEGYDFRKLLSNGLIRGGSSRARFDLALMTTPYPGENQRTTFTLIELLVAISILPARWPAARMSGGW